MIRTVILIASILLFISSIFFIFGYFSTSTVITYDGNSFSPSELTIPYGETVTFKNKSKEPFWPASNLHPSHLVFSDFDPKEPIAPGDSWSFTFERAGEWGYHDHIRATAKGAVNVLNPDGTVFRLSCTDGMNKLQCWERMLLRALDEGGVEKAFDVFGDLYQTEPEFAQGCHGLVHILGERSYEQFITDESFSLTSQTQFCGYGFFHGFMETLLIQSGDLDLSRKFCTFVEKTLSSENPSAGGACYHGIGHGAIDGGDPRDWGDAYAIAENGLELCAKVGLRDFEQQICGTGVFDAVGIALKNGDYGLSVSKETVYELCEQVDAFYKPGCYDQINTLIWAMTGSDMEESLSIINTMEEREYYQDSLVSLAATYGRSDHSLEGRKEAIRLCHTLDEQSRISCTTGFATGLVELGPPGQEYEWGMQFCGSEELGKMEKKSCFLKVVNNAGLLFPRSEMQRVCNLVPAEYADVSTLEYCSA